MTPHSSKPRVLVFIGSLRSGGKERRLVELLTYFKEKSHFEFLVVLTRDEIHYKDFYKLEIPYKVIEKKWRRNDPTVFHQVYKICKTFKPHIIHTWGSMQSFYTLPAVIGQRIPLVNSQIAGAPVKLRKLSVTGLIDRLNFRFSKVVLANSYAGMACYNPPVSKRKVIYNGINMSRFANLPCINEVKVKYGITTPYAVLMVASYNAYKDYGLFFQVADYISRLRADITFIGVGGYDKDDSEYKRMLHLSAGNPRILFFGSINDVEALVNACTIGVLFSTNGEGISNSIMEYMALAKPVIASAPGGTRELVHHNENGYLIINEPVEKIAALIINLINDGEKRERFGTQSKRIIDESFSLESMGKAFEQVYEEVLAMDH